jgi:hypothetical protein
MGCIYCVIGFRAIVCEMCDEAGVRASGRCGDREKKVKKGLQVLVVLDVRDAGLVLGLFAADRRCGP